MFQKFNKLLHGGLSRKRGGNMDVLSLPFLKKYLQYAKDRFRPVLTEEVQPTPAPLRARHGRLCE